MKKDRNVGGASPYTMYPTYQGMPGPLPMPGAPVPGMPMGGGCGCSMGNNMGPMPMNPNMSQMPMGNNMQTQSPSNPNSMQEQINQLDRRVSRLEAALSDSKTAVYSNNRNYTDANYHMM